MGRIACNALFYGVTRQEIDDAIDEECGPDPDRVRGTQECKIALAQCQATEVQLRDAIAQQAAQCADMAGKAEALAEEIRGLSNRMETLATAVGAALAIIGLARLGTMALSLRAAGKISARQEASLLGAARAQEQATLANVQIVQAARIIRLRSESIVRAANEGRPLTIQIVGGAR